MRPPVVLSLSTHADVGGGAEPNGMEYSLAYIPLRWMVRECFRAGTGIRFHKDRLEKIGLDPAIMAAPLITTILDTCTILVYFNIVTAVFKI